VSVEESGDALIGKEKKHQHSKTSKTQQLSSSFGFKFCYLAPTDLHTQRKIIHGNVGLRRSRQEENSSYGKSRFHVPCSLFAVLSSAQQTSTEEKGSECKVAEMVDTKLHLKSIFCSLYSRIKKDENEWKRHNQARKAKLNSF
jgi:hypothetical protein